MLAKYWKKICILILIIACLFNIMLKLVNRISFNKEIISSARYMYDEYQREKDKNVLRNSENVVKNSNNT